MAHSDQTSDSKDAVVMDNNQIINKSHWNTWLKEIYRLVPSEQSTVDCEQHLVRRHIRMSTYRGIGKPWTPGKTIGLTSMLIIVSDLMKDYKPSHDS